MARDCDQPKQMNNGARRLVGFAGQTGSGKEYVATLLDLQVCWDGGFTFVPMANIVRRDVEATLSEADGLRASCPALWTKPHSEEAIHLLQWWGWMRRAEDRFYWIRPMVEAVIARRPDPIAVIGIRFKLEADAIRALGGVVVEVRAEPRVRRERLGGVKPRHFDVENIGDLDPDGIVHFWGTDEPVVWPEVLIPWLGGAE